MTEILHVPNDSAGAFASIPRKRNDLEHAEQKALFEWLAYKTNQDPLFGLAYAIPNGGNRDAVTGARLKNEGVKPGIPDICWPVPKAFYLDRVRCGLYVELKPTGYDLARVPLHQLAAGAALGFGYEVRLCIGLDDARAGFEDYDALPFPAWFNVSAARRAAADYLAAVEARRTKRSKVK